MAATPNPMRTGSMAAVQDKSPVDSKTYHIAGILTTVYGLDLLPAETSSVAVLWLLHPRGQTHEIMAPVASAMIHAWNATGASDKGLIAVSFDQRNHGTRMVSELSNESWSKGNERHAVDMFGIFHGTAKDASLLLSYLPAYIFPPSAHSRRTITQNLVLGISLGGHAAWHCLLHDPRFSAAVSVIGCPDYARLMLDRARRSKLPAATADAGGAAFFGSDAFPPALVEQVGRFDPAGALWGVPAGAAPPLEPGEAERARLRPVVRELLGGRRILCLWGGRDRLVPFAQGEPFLSWLEHAVRPDGGWCADLDVGVEDVGDPEAGHEYSPLMAREAARFVCESLARGGGREEVVAVGRGARM